MISRLLSLVLRMAFFSGKLSCGCWEVMQSTVLAQHSCCDAAKENISKRGAWTFALQGSFSQCSGFSSSIPVCSLPFPGVLGVEARVSAPVTCSTERRLPDLQSILGLYITECKGINVSLHLGLHQKQSVKSAFSFSLCCLGNFAGSQLTLTLFLFSSQQMCEWRVSLSFLPQYGFCSLLF